MSKPLKITIIISTIVITVILALMIAVTATSFDFFVADITNHPYYTEDEYKEGVEKAKDDAFKEKEEYEKLIQQYRDEIMKNNQEVLNLNAQISELTNNNASLEIEKDNAVRAKQTAENKVSELQTQISENEKTILDNEEKISSLKEQVSSLEQNKEENRATIEALNNKVSGLEIVNQQLKETNDINSSTISTLTAQIISLNSQISLLQSQIAENQSVVKGLNEKISNLEKSIAYYEKYISDLETEEKFVATFEFGGSVYSVCIVEHGGFASVENPSSTDYVIFNYWEVAGERQDVSSYQITENTRFIANCTYKFDVKFMNGESEVETQIVEKDHFATSPVSQPEKEDFIFDGWTLNGVDVVDVSSYKITQNVTFVAKFSRLLTVKFVVDGEDKSVQKLKSGSFATPYSVSNSEHKRFVGWKVNDKLVESVESFEILSDTVFVADFIESFDVKFTLDGSPLDTKIVEENSCVSDMPVAEKDGFYFLGWSKDGEHIVDVSNEKIVNETTFQAVMFSLDSLSSDVFGYKVLAYNAKNLKIIYGSLEEKVLFVTGQKDELENYYLFEFSWFTAVDSFSSFKTALENSIISVKVNVFETFIPAGHYSGDIDDFKNENNDFIPFVSYDALVSSKGGNGVFGEFSLYHFNENKIVKKNFCVFYEESKTLDDAIWYALIRVFWGNTYSIAEFSLYGNYDDVVFEYSKNTF